MLTTLIFDIDLTLVNSLDACAKGTNMIADRFGLERKTREEVLACISLPLGPYWGRLWGRYDPEWLEYFKSDVEPVIDLNGPLYPGATDLLRHARNKGILLAVATNRKNPWLDLAKMGIAHLFDTAVGAEEGLKPKPEPDIPLRVIKQLHSEPVNTIFVGDSRFDMLAAKAAGIRALGLKQGGTPEKDLLDAGAWRVKSYITDVKEILDSSQGFGFQREKLV
ncbi:MAG: HAD family hydrolase [Deltaproteobacteria bacterium]|jgi:HAD superfamily hydrolase (TIGR01509 family)|nr:HAD family hydrolase [Deltaproteobacteria bacterium]